jgi:Bacterial Ig-like domain (group 3)
MGQVWGRVSGLRAALVVAALGVFVAALAFGAGPATAGACNDNWTGNVNNDWFNTGNWSTNAVPTNSTLACIPNGSFTVVINGQTEASTSAASASFLMIGTGDTLQIQGVNASSTPDAATLALATGGSVASTATIKLTASCNPTVCSTGAPSELLISTGTLAMDGTLTADPGSDNGSNLRELIGSVDNTGTINANANLTVPGSGSTLTNDSGGQITNNGGSGAVLMKNNTTFVEGAGTTSPNTPNAPHPAVIIDSLGNTPTPILSYVGSGASTIASRETAKLQGNLAAGQNLAINPGGGCSGASQVTAASGFTNAGTITLAGTCDSGLILTTGTLTNTGTLVTNNTGSSITSEIAGGLANSGTFTVDGGTAFDKSGATLKQTAGGTTTIANGGILDSGPSGSTFQLQGGVLTGGGHSQATAAVVNGAVSNTGGNIIPGSTGVPGIMTVGGNYTQGSGGKLSVVINGAGTAGVGKAYSQLSSGGNVTLGGTLAITTVATPAVNDLDTITGGGSRSGTFSTVTGLFTPGSTYGYKVNYGSNFAALEVGAALKVNRAGPGSGTVTSSPAGINCGTQCDTPFFQLQVVTLTAHPSSGSGFQSWSGVSGCGLATTCKVTMSQARTVTASFGKATTTTLTSSANPGHVNKSVTYTATVSPKPGGGTVRFTDNGKTISGCGAVAVSSSTGKATCKITYRAKGTHTIGAAYSGNATFGQSAASTLKETVKA